MSKTALFYQYRDASNYKAFGYVTLAGAIPSDFERRIKATLIDGQWFVAEQVRIPALRYLLYISSNGPTIDDHSWHEFIRVGDLPNDFAPEAVMDAGELLAGFETAQRQWDHSRSPI